MIRKKEDIINHKKSAIGKLNRTFETFINSSNGEHLKKADLLAYWIQDYSKYLIDEKTFDYNRVLRFKRGQIISANFGYNIGSEHGGLHYAIVLDNDNKLSSPVITVIPLSSYGGGHINNRDVDLGNELYTKLKAKYDADESDYKDLKNRNDKLIDLLEKSGVKELLDKGVIAESESPLSLCYQERERLISKSKNLDRHLAEINKMKSGSIALMEQITTISKMRIYRPKSKHDLLYGIKFSNGTMDKINKKLKELYIFER